MTLMMFTTIKQGEKVLAFCSYLHNATSYINIQSQSICTTVPARWQMNTFQIPKSLKPSCSNLNGNETCLLHNITQLKMATAELEQRDGSSQHNYSSPIRFTPGNQPKLSKRRRGLLGGGGVLGTGQDDVSGAEHPDQQIQQLALLYRLRTRQGHVLV